MTNHLKNYLDVLSKTSPDAVTSVENTVNKIIPEYIDTFSHHEHIRGLLLGEVQSGKTSQILGLIAGSADTDEGFKVFVLLTTDNTALQQQTLKRALASMDTFNVCDEHDEVRFMEVGARRPSLVVLKKNSNILKSWRNILASSGFCSGRPIFVVDDEADAASLNTLINKQEQSTINSHLEAILNLSTSSFYLQVTATPQSLFLQSEESGWRPAFVHYFPPGKNYLGGSFFYSKPHPFTNRMTEDDELAYLLNHKEVPEGLKIAIENYLVTAAHTVGKFHSKVCNFLIHPSSKISDHEIIKDAVTKYLDYIFMNLDSREMVIRLEAAWTDLKKSRPDITSFEEIINYLLSKPEIAVRAMNSAPQNDSHLSYDEGLNIVIGGNSLGRGVTFKSLQTVYYCRSAKSPQADTFWQHCRMFGYDRDPLLMRVFMPEALFNLFSEINDSNEVLIAQILENRFHEIQIVTSGKIKPTRKSVIDIRKYDYIIGGVNYFPPSPDQDNGNSLDGLLNKYDDSHPIHDIKISEMIEILNGIKDDIANDWSIESFKNALLAVKSQKGTPDLAKLIIRRNRNITRGTGTLLSPDDRKLGDGFSNLPVLTLYRLNGLKENKWNGYPFWIPNIKLPSGKVFHRVT
jgi:hypothetical protein